MTRTRRGRAGWSAARLPTARRDLVRTLDEATARMARVSPDDSLTASEIADGLADFSRLRRVLTVGDMYWVASAMGAAALDASHDVPEISYTDAPGPLGLMAFESPLPPLDTRGYGAEPEVRGDIPLDAIAWQAGHDHIDVDLLVRTRHLPTPPPTGGSADALFPLAHFASRLPVSLDAEPVLLTEQSVTHDRSWTHILALLSAAWVMMMTPTVATRTTLDTSTGRTSPAEPGALQGRESVTIIDLRPLRHLTDPDAVGSGRTLRTRHLVRGHWTHQPHGPGGQLRRLQWVASYVRGPEGAPWRTTSDTVYAWRR